MKNKLYALTRRGVRTMVEGMSCGKAYVLTDVRKIYPVDESSIERPVFTKAKIAFHCDVVIAVDVPENAVYLHDVSKLNKKHLITIEKRLDSYSKKFSRLVNISGT